MTRQEVFDKIVLGFAQQKALAGGMNGGCYYRQPETGNKCAVGLLIPDEVFVSEIEGESPCSIYGTYQEFLSSGYGHEGVANVGQFLGRLIDEEGTLPKENLTFLEDVQQMHDTAFSGHELFFNLKNTAIDWSLDISLLVDNEKEFNWK